MNYLLKRLGLAIPVVFGVCTLTFFLIHFVPGDPVEILLGDQATTIDKQALRESLGLHLPLFDQYINFWRDLLQFDLGRSLHSREPVLTHIAASLPGSLELTIGAIIIAILIGLPFGVLAAIKQNTWIDQSIVSFGVLGMSLPSFFLAPLLIWGFAIHLGWLPVSERGDWTHLILPSLSLALPMSAILIRMTRTAMLEVIREDFISVAFAKGLAPIRVYFHHALRNALIPVITILGLQVGSLLTGAVITETIFDWPGIGTLLLGSIQRRDYPTVQACVLLISLTYVFVNLATDIIYTWVNPKVRLS